MASTSDNTKRRNTVPLRRLTNPSLQQHLPCPQCPLWFKANVGAFTAKDAKVAEDHLQKPEQKLAKPSPELHSIWCKIRGLKKITDLSAHLLNLLERKA